MRKFLIGLLLLLCAIFQSLKAQERNFNQEIIDFVESGRYFEAKDLYTSIEVDSLHPFVIDFYNYSSFKMENKLDSAIYYLDRILDNSELSKSNILLIYCRNLFEDYLKVKNYEQAYLVTNKIENLLNINSFELSDEDIDGWRSGIQSMREYVNEIKKHPLTSISKINRVNNSTLRNEDMLIFDAIYNGDTLRTFFDTGFTLPFYANEKIGEKIGTKDIVINNGNNKLNNTKLQFSLAIIDSVEIGNVNILNVLVGLYHFDPLEVSDFDKLNDSKKDQSKKNFESFDIVMGLPAMQLMDKIVIDFESKAIIFPDSTEFSNDKKPNLFFFDGFLFTQLKINDLPFTAQVDFGYLGYINIYTSFYDKYKIKIPIDTLSKKEPLDLYMIHKAWSDIPYEVPLDPHITFNHKEVIVDVEDKVQIYSNPDDPMPKLLDGVVGLHFFKKLGKRILFDFKNRRLEILE